MAKSKKSYSLNDSKKPKEALEKYYRAIVAMHKKDHTDLDNIFDVAVDNKAFPNIQVTGEKTEPVYIEHWTEGYESATDNPPSGRTATPKTACSDPALKLIVQTAKCITDEEAAIAESHHNLFMSAENIQGNLLEQYIAKHIHPYGFIWCNGNTVRAVDFCNDDGTVLLQIKNKSNSENSSSSNIREGTTIIKWYRLGTQRKNGKTLPKFRWEILNDIINTHKTKGFDLPPCNMSEEEYENFLLEVARNNPDIISDL